MKNKKPRTKNLTLHNPVLDKQVRGKQNGFTQHLASRLSASRRIYAERTKLGAGFIPMIIMLLLILAAVVWVVYSRVAHSHG